MAHIQLIVGTRCVRLECDISGINVIMNHSNNTLEEFISSFNRYEAEAGVFALRDEEDYPWWDLVRYRVQFALCVERKFYRNGKSATSPSLVIRAQSFARQMQRLLRDIARLSRLNARHFSTLIVSRRSLDYIKVFAVAEASRANGAVFVNETGNADAPHAAITSQSIEFFTRLTKCTQRLPPQLEREAMRLANDIRRRFESQVDIFGVIANKYREEMIARRAWSFILNRATTLERVVFVNDDTLKSLVKLAGSRGLATEEVQHAYMGKAHIGFSYPPLDTGLATLPDRVIVTLDTGDITYPVKRVVVKTISKQRRAVPRDIDVLIGSSPSRQKEAADFAMALRGHGHQVAVKLHPSETRQSWKVANRFSYEDVVIYNGSENFCDLACRARLFIPMNSSSTAAFEAAEMGALVVLVHFGGVKKSVVTDAVASAHVYSLDDLPLAVQLQLALTHDESRIDAGESK